MIPNMEENCLALIKTKIVGVCHGIMHLLKFNKSDAVLSIDFVQAASATTASATASTHELPELPNRHISNKLKPKFMTFTHQVAASYSFKITPNLHG